MESDPYNMEYEYEVILDEDSYWGILGVKLAIVLSALAHMLIL